MFNWFQRSSKSAAAARVAASAARRRPAGTATAAPVPADRLPGGLGPAGTDRAGLAEANEQQALARLPECARQLSPDAQRILAHLPPGVALVRSCTRYPQAVEKLLKHWRHPAEFRAALDAMVMDSRGGRQGFPFDIVSEFSALREYYDLHVSPVKTTAWASATIR
jgi:hypothetical protein